MENKNRFSSSPSCSIIEIGNLLVILVVLVSRRLKTITNFFLANLAVADFCIGIFCVYQNLSVYLIKRWVTDDSWRVCTLERIILSFPSNKKKCQECPRTKTERVKNLNSISFLTAGFLAIFYAKFITSPTVWATQHQFSFSSWYAWNATWRFSIPSRPSRFSRRVDWRVSSLSSGSALWFIHHRNFYMCKQSLTKWTMR